MKIKTMAKRAGAIACAIVAATAAAMLFAGAAFADEPELAGDPYELAAEVDLPDGAYSIDVVKEGGSGRADVDSPARLDVVDGHGVATIVWSSPNYDYMLVDGLKYISITEDPNENSAFVIPVTVYGEPMDVVGDTTAMGTPHEIEYQLTFDFDSVVAGAPEAAAAGDAAADAAADGSASAAADAVSDGSASAAALDTSADASASASAPSASAEQGINPAIIIAVIVVALVVGIAIGVVRGRKNR